MKNALLSLLWQFVGWRWLCIKFVRLCPVSSWSDWIFYHTGLGSALADVFVDAGDFDRAIRLRQEVRRLQALYERA